MAKRRYSLFHLCVQKLASSRPVSWFLARTLHHVDHVVLKLTGARATATSFLAGAPIVWVTTTGAKSGAPRTLPLLCIRDGHAPHTFALIASNWGQRRHPAWYWNLKARPRVTCTLDGKTGPYLAHEASAEEYDQFWQSAVDTYLGYALYRQRAGGRHIPIVVLEPARS